ncbi:MAG: DNA topoisomerase 3 [Bacillota bacterium]
MNLVIAEKPSVARAIADALGKPMTREGYLESGGYQITWALGHLCDLARPEQYDSAYAHWRMEHLPIIPPTWRVEPRPGRDYEARLKAIKALAGRATGLVNACDAGREGELIFRWVVEVLRLEQKPTRRVWLSSLTPEEIRAAFNDLKPGADYDPLYAGALARARADWLTGINGTRAFTLRFGSPGQGVLSVGRVQTPTLALIVRREAEISAFRPEDYWQVLASLETQTARFRARWEDAAENSRLASLDEASGVEARLRAAGRATVAQVDSQDITTLPTQLHDLTSLQREAHRRFGLTAAKTLEAAQALYEAGLLTYPRTDSRHVTESLAATFPGLLSALLALPHYSSIAGQANADLAMGKRVVDNAKVSDHHALLPTARTPRSQLPEEQARIYDLVARRFLANCLPAARDRRQRVTLLAGQDRLVARGSVEVERGWRLVEAPEEGKEGEEEEGSPLPVLQEGETVQIASVGIKTLRTKPPRHYTEGTLLAAMEAAGKDLDDEDARDAMKARGLGTPATRAAIIERLKAVGYIAADNKTLRPTEKGLRLLALVERSGATTLASVALTGDWEARILDVEQGRASAADLERDIADYVNGLVNQVRTASPEPGGDDTSWPPCPVCGGPVTPERFELRCATPGCTLRVSRRLLGRVLTDQELCGLLRQRRTPLLDGFTGKNGKSFSAVLALREKGDGVLFEFPAPRAKAPAKGRAASGRPRKAAWGTKR